VICERAPGISYPQAIPISPGPVFLHNRIASLPFRNIQTALAFPSLASPSYTIVEVNDCLPLHPHKLSALFSLLTLPGLARGVGRKHMQVPCRRMAAIPSMPFLGPSSSRHQCHCGQWTRRQDTRRWRCRGLRCLIRDSDSVGCSHSRIARQGNRRRRLQRHCWCQRHHRPRTPHCWSVGPGCRPL
jgi:hypothetical protein